MTQSDLEPAGARSWPWTWAVALDGGTTNTRARLIRDGRIVATARRGVGVRDTVLTADRPLADAVREAIAEVLAFPGETAPVKPDLIVAAGMLSSDVGLAAVPHVLAPAGIDELAAAVVLRQIPEVSGQPIAIVPGVRTPAGDGPDGWMTADVMRGEECETLGAWSRLAALGALGAVPQARTQTQFQSQAFLWPGSHTKLVEVDAHGRISRSQTSLAGELLQAVARHTLVAASLPEALPDKLDLDAVSAAARAVGRDGLGRAAFLVRIAALTETLGPRERASFWIGAIVADDAAHLARHPILGGERPRPLWVGGRQPLRDLYVERLRGVLQGPVTPIDDELAEAASALGALEIAGRRLEQDGQSRGATMTD